MLVSRMEKSLGVIIIICAILMARDIISSKTIFQGEIPDPIQTNLTDAKVMNHIGKKGEVIILAKAKYEIEGVIKSKKKYLDFASQISNYDLAMAWGTLNKSDIDQYIKYSQGGRWYRFKYSHDIPGGSDYLSNHSANVHIIHKDKKVLKDIKRMKKNDHVRLKGFLVDVDFSSSGGSLWQTSLSRNDTGGGACEILYVEEAMMIK